MSLLSDYIYFLLKTLTLVIALLFMFSSMIILSKHKNKSRMRLSVKHVNDDYDTYASDIQDETLGKADLKKAQKIQKKALASIKDQKRKRLFYLSFIGDMQASEADNLREKITAILTVATPEDEVVVTVDSAGGVVHGYGLCASQLSRLRTQHIPLTVIVDKVAASGGYMMASVADTIIAAPFAIIGSIGVVAQLPNFHRLLKTHDIDFEQVTAGEYKRTLTLFGENTDKAREKCQEDITQVHHLFKQFISQYRPQLDMSKVATGEYWFGTDALALKLIDRIGTSDDYLLQASKTTDIYEINYTRKRSFMQKCTQSLSLLLSQWTSTGIK